MASAQRRRSISSSIFALGFSTAARGKASAVVANATSDNNAIDTTFFRIITYIICAKIVNFPINQKEKRNDYCL